MLYFSHWRTRTLQQHSADLTSSASSRGKGTRGKKPERHKEEDEQNEERKKNRTKDDDIK